MKDEFNNFGSETNKAISEYKELKAVEYYTQKEVAKSPLEMVNVPETSDSSALAEADNKSDIEELEDLQDKINNANNNLRNTADGTNVPDSLAQAEAATGESAAVTTASTGASVTAASTAAASSASTVAALSGSVGIVALAAAAVVTVSTGVLSSPPKLVSEHYESGTNFLLYEIELDELKEGTNYKIRVSNANFIVEYPVTEAGMQTQLVTGLTPYRKYDVSVIGDSGIIKDEVFYSTPVYTDKLEKPRAVIELAPNFNYLLGTFDLVYSAYISDYYKTGSNFYLELISDNTLIATDDNIDEDNFISGAIKGLSDLTTFGAKVYATYYDEVVEIGSKGYTVVYPDDFVVSNDSIYDEIYNNIEIDNVEYVDEGFKLSIDTGFTPKDNNDSYIIDLEYTVDDSELVAETVKTITKEGNSKLIDVTIPGNVNSFDVYFTPVKTIGDEKKKYEKRKIKSFSLNAARLKAPKPTATVLYTEDYDTENEIYNVNYDVSVLDTFLTGSNYRIEERINGRLINEFILETKTYNGSFKHVNNGDELTVNVYATYNGEEIELLSDKMVAEHDDVFNNPTLSLSEGYLLFTCEYNKRESGKEFDYELIQKNVDGTTKEYTDKFTDFCEIGKEILDNDITSIDQIDSFEINISYNGNILASYNYSNNESIALGDVDADIDGNILIPYEITIAENAIVDNVSASFDGIEMIELDGLKNNIIIEEISTNILERGRIRLAYKLDGILIEKEIEIDSINIGATVEVSYFVHCNSGYYNTVDFKFDALLGDKIVNIDVMPYYKTEEASGVSDYNSFSYNQKDGKYYIVDSMPESITYKVTADGFDNTETTVTGFNTDVKSETDLESFSFGYSDNGQYIRYAKTYNDDGTVNYYFDTNFNDGSGNHYEKIFYSYTTETGRIVYKSTDYFTGNKYQLLNIPDKDYSFTSRVFYKSSNTGLYYDMPKRDLKVDYQCNLFDKSNAIIDSAIVFSEANSGYNANINLKLNYKTIDFSKPVTITYDNTDYVIELKGKDDSMPTIENGYYYTVENANYSYTVKIMGNSDSNYQFIYVELVKNIGSDYTTASTTAHISYSGGPYELGTIFSDIDFSSITGPYDKDVGIFESTLDLSEAEYSYEQDSSRLYVSRMKLNLVDENDCLYIAAFYNGKEIARSSRISYIETSLDIEPLYKNVELRLLKTKYYENYDFINGSSEDYITPILGNEFIRNYETLVPNAANSINISLNYDSNYIVVEAPEADFTDKHLYFTVSEDGGNETNGAIESTSYTKEGVTLDDVNKLTIKIKASYNGSYTSEYDAIYGMFEIPITATLGELNNGKIDYSIDLGSNYTISDSSVTISSATSETVEINSSSGSIEVTQELVESVNFRFDLKLTDENGVVINYSFTVTKGF